MMQAIEAYRLNRDDRRKSARPEIVILSEAKNLDARSIS